MTQHKFAIGEIALIARACGHSTNNYPVGTEVEIIELPGPMRELRCPFSGRIRWLRAGKYLVRAGDSEPCSILESGLKKRDGQDDGRTLVSWDKCVWRPTRVVAQPGLLLGVPSP